MAKIERFKTRTKEISVVGTGHVLRKSLQAVKSEIRDFGPDVVALELDLPRFIALTTRRRPKPKGIKEQVKRGFLTEREALKWLMTRSESSPELERWLRRRI